MRIRENLQHLAPQKFLLADPTADVANSCLTPLSECGCARIGLIALEQRHGIGKR